MCPGGARAPSKPLILRPWYHTHAALRYQPADTYTLRFLGVPLRIFVEHSYLFVRDFLFLEAKINLVNEVVQTCGETRRKPGQNFRILAFLYRCVFMC